MTTPPVPDRLAEIVAQAVARLEAAGEAVTPEAVAATATPAGFRLADVESIVLWAVEVALADYLRSRDA